MKFRDFNDAEVELPAGRKFFWRPSAYAWIVINGKILLVRGRANNRWGLPGGAIELGERIIIGLQREVLEETGYEVKVDASLPIFFKERYFYANDVDEYYQAIGMVFKAKLLHDKQKKKIDEHEVAEVKWIDLKDLHKYPLSPYSKEIFSALQ